MTLPLNAPSLQDILAVQLYWEDLPPGTCYSTPTRTITETDIVSFAALTGDFNRMHVDAEYAAASVFGQRLAHGMLVASISVGLNTRSIVNQLLEPSLAGLLENRLQFPKPSFIGDTIGVRVEVVEQRETRKPDRGVIVFRRSTVNQRQETVVESTVAMLVMRRHAAQGTPA